MVPSSEDCIEITFCTRLQCISLHLVVLVVRLLAVLVVLVLVFLHATLRRVVRMECDG